VQCELESLGSLVQCRVCGGQFNPARVDLATLPDCSGAPSSLSSADRGVAARPQAGNQCAIIIAGRNNAQYLAEAIESALAQSVSCDVIYSDDASSDDSLAIARRYLHRGLILVSSGTQAGPCAARNRGADATGAPLLCWLDADDRLPPNYLAQHLAAWSLGVPFVYGPAQAFGDCAVLWPVPPWERYDRWMCNTVNTSALYDRRAWEAAGRWDGSLPTMWDWDLALRASRTTEVLPRPSAATIEYRQHAGSWSHTIHETTRDPSQSLGICYRETIRRRLASLTVVCLLSGRLPDLLNDWLERIAGSVYFAQLRQPVTLIALLHNEAACLQEPLLQGLQRHARTFASWRVERWQNRLVWDDEPGRRDAVAQFMATSCQALRDRATGDLLWFVEDDILVKRDTCAKLFAASTAGDCPPHAVGAPYRNRHVPTQFVGGHQVSGRWAELQTLPTADVVPVDFTGTGCLMTWADRPAIPKEWRSHEQGVAAHDWAYCLDIRRSGGQVQILPSAPVGHARTAADVLWP